MARPSSSGTDLALPEGPNNSSCHKALLTCTSDSWKRLRLQWSARLLRRQSRIARRHGQDWNRSGSDGPSRRAPPGGRQGLDPGSKRLAARPPRHLPRPIHAQPSPLALRDQSALPGRRLEGVRRSRGHSSTCSRFPTVDQTCGRGRDGERRLRVRQHPPDEEAAAGELQRARHLRARPQAGRQRDRRKSRLAASCRCASVPRRAKTSRARCGSGTKSRAVTGSKGEDRPVRSPGRARRRRIRGRGRAAPCARSVRGPRARGRTRAGRATALVASPRARRRSRFSGACTRGRR